MTDRELLQLLLDCDEKAVIRLEKVKYDLAMIMEMVEEEGWSVNYNTLMCMAFSKAQEELSDALERRLEEEENLDTFALLEELFYPDKDMYWDSGCQKTQCYLRHLHDYRKYLKSEIAKIEENMGEPFTEA